IFDPTSGESHFINKIVLEILAYIKPNAIENNLIGIETHIDALNSLLDLDETEEVRMVGIWGMGGIDKTKITQAMFRRISYKFDGSSFVKDVRQNCSNKKDVCALQQKILSDVLMMNYFMIEDPDEGAETIKDRFHKNKVFLVLDDLDNPQQKEFLAETNTCFSIGGMLLKLTSPDDYKELSYRVVCYAGCLPLALKCKDKERLNRILDSFGFDSVIGISVLIEKSLITVSKKRLEMHDLIQEMGWQIVRDIFTNNWIWELEEMQNRIIHNTV
ncbi:TMV resistance protein N-like protein, partial [Tanacetum coccineum]